MTDVAHPSPSSVPEYTLICDTCGTLCPEDGYKGLGDRCPQAFEGTQCSGVLVDYSDNPEHSHPRRIEYD